MTAQRGDQRQAGPSTAARFLTRVRHLAREAREMEPSSLAFRVRWELALRTGWTALTERAPAPLDALARVGAERFLARLPFADPLEVRRAVADRLPPDARAALTSRAEAALRGRVRCFGRWTADFGDPIDWYLNPATQQRWSATAHWTETLRDTGRVGDVKLTWEVARFPQAFDVSRAAILGDLPPAATARALGAQIAGFLRASPYGRGVHWASGQEIVFRLFAWAFAAAALRHEPELRPALAHVARHAYEGAVHVERHFDYVLRSVTNNHLVSEACGLLLAAALVPEARGAKRWEAMGLDVLTAQAERQVYADGGYLMHSHNYHRAALQPYLLACALLRHRGQQVPSAWIRALDRSLTFLAAHQNPDDGRLPNFGSNDGALPLPITSCDYSDFRPLLQALAYASRGERIYEPGPWDEETAWLFGARALEAPLRRPHRASIAFRASGFSVLRGHAPGTFACFRCGTLRHRFAQIDMLHVDLFWRGENVLVDGGSYLYNGPAEWHHHFTGAASHNTLTVDGLDQMVQHRRFKLLYLTRARLLRFEDDGKVGVAEGEHDGFRRHPGRCVHRRTVLRGGDDLWVVVDRVGGQGAHAARLHWLAGPYPFRNEPDAGRLTLETPRGGFTVTVLDGAGAPLAGDVVAGQEHPPRGWLSRHYGEKVPAPSLAVTQRAGLPLVFVTLLAAGAPRVEIEDGRWTVEAGDARLVLPAELVQAGAR